MNPEQRANTGQTRAGNAPSIAATRVARLAGVIVLLTSCLVLAGWALKFPQLTNIVPGWPRMVALTALAFALASISLCLALPPLIGAQWLPARFPALTRWQLSRACALFAVLIGLTRLAAYLFGWDATRLEHLTVNLPMTSDQATKASMSPATAVGFVLIGGALLWVRARQLMHLCQVLSVLTLFVGWLGIARFVFGGMPLIPFSAMALHTGILFLLLSLGVLASRSDAGVTAILLSEGAGGASARHLLPAALLLPLAAGALALYSEHAGWLGAQGGVSVFALSSVVVFAGLVLANAAHLEHADRERLGAVQALRESQELLQAIMDNSQAVVYVKHLDGRYLLVNRRYEEIFARQRTDILGRTDHDLFSKGAADAFRAMDLRAVAANHALTEEETVPQVDGMHVYISVKAPLRNAAGETCGVFGISTDITDRKRAEDRLRTQLARLSLLDETTRAIAERHGLRSIFQVVLRSLEEHWPIDFGCACGYQPASQTLSITCMGTKSQALAPDLALAEGAHVAVDENGLGRCLRGELVYESDIGGASCAFPARLAGGGLRSVVFAPLVVESKVFGVIIAGRRQAGSFTSNDCEFLRQLSGHVALAAHQSQLYADLQRAYEDLRQTQQTVMQQERLRALGQMASGIAHDINNALSPAALYIQSLLDHDRTLGKGAREYLLITQRAIDDVANTVARMREFYRLREPQLTLVPVDLNAILQQVLDLTHARWSDMPQERGFLINVRQEFAPLLPTIMGAESEIRDALTNLVLNAVDAMAEGGTLTLRSYADEATQVVVEVCDTGAGMDEAVRSRCLEPFFTTKGERGTGLGLAMVYGMVQRHSAEIEIESTVGEGTTVRLSFVPAHALPTHVAEHPANIHATVRLRLLLVDDDPLLSNSLEEVLQQEGHEVVVADGGQEGINTFLLACQRAEPFALVITDLGMPDVDGRKVAAAVKAASPQTPVIMLTGWGRRLVEDKDIPPDVDRILSKPPKLGELRAALAGLTGSGARALVQKVS